MKTRIKIILITAIVLSSIVAVLFIYINPLTNEKAEISTFKPKKINLIIKEKSYSKLLELRGNAFKRGFLITDDESWVKAEIENEDSSKVKIKIRLKGDLLDHLEGEKWSYRVKVRNGKSWNRLRTFSLQNPSVREFLNEWFYHKFLEKEDVLCPRYDFIELSINGKSKGIYAYEEHFDKQLVEHRNRREGPIVKFTEDGLWAGKQRGSDYTGETKYSYSLTDFYESNSIKAFKESKTLADTNLYHQYLIAHRLMNQYKYQLKEPDDFFDVDKLAKFYAINDVCGAWHGLFWNNQRFYFNPIIQKLEPVAYDGFSYAPNWTGKPFYGYGMYNKNKKYNDGSWVFYTELFMDSLFMSKYIKQVNLLSDSPYIEKLMKEFEEDITGRELFLQTEFPNYTFDRKKLVNKAKNVASYIYPFDKISVKIFPKDNGKIAVFNHHKLPLVIIGEGDYEEISKEYEQPILLEVQLNFGLPYEYKEVEINDSSTYLYYKILGLDSIFSSEISKIELNEQDVPQQEILLTHIIFNQKIKNISYINNDIIMDGNFIIDDFIVIPKGYRLIIKEGAKIDFINGAGLISYSPIEAIGSEEQPIIITSKDKTARGFTVLQAGDYSKLKNVYFSDFNSLSYKGWDLIGAITFYESNVLINNCVFADNNCEDMLNIVRSSFDINNMTISNAYSDGFDADFCTGTVNNSKFYTIGNDGMDFSGSTIKINHCEVKNAGDKGISVGEQSIVYGIDILIEIAPIGFASKDLSTFGVDKATFINCDTALVAFQKKSEFGGGKLSIKNIEQKNIGTLYFKDDNSTIKIDGKKIK